MKHYFTTRFVLCMLAVTWLISFNAIAGTGSISGEVVDGSNETLKIEGYYVVVMDEHWNELGGKYTLADGTFTIDGLPADTPLILEVRHNVASEYVGQYYEGKNFFDAANRIVLSPDEQKTGVIFRLEKAPNNEIQGQVREGETGVFTYVALYSPSTNFRKEISTDSSGIFVIRYIKPAPDYILYTHYNLQAASCETTVTFHYMMGPQQIIGMEAPSASSLTYDMATRFPIDAASYLYYMDLIVDTSGLRTIEGDVMAVGYPVSGCGIYVYENNIGFSKTDIVTLENGHYIACGIPASDKISVYADGASQYYPKYYNGTQDPSSVEFINTLAGNVSGKNFSLMPLPSNSISGTVRDMAKNGIQTFNGFQLEVYAVSGETNFEKKVPVNSDGTYSITMLAPSSKYAVYTYVQFAPNCYAQYYFTSNDSTSVLHWSQRKELDVQENTNLTNIDLIIDPDKPRIIEGYVKGKDPSFPNGKPLYGYHIAVNDAYSDVDGYTETDETGYYRICGFPAIPSARIHVTPPDGVFEYFGQYFDKQFTEDTAKLISTMNSPVPPINFLLERTPPNIITGFVRDATGEGMSNIDVNFYSESTGYRNTARTDTIGKYTLSGLMIASDYRPSVYHLMDGNWIEFFYFKADQSVTSFSQATVLTIGNDTNLKDINIVIGKGAVIRGTVFVGDSGHPAPPGIRVEAWSPSTESGAEAVTNDQGIYEIIGLNPNIADYLVIIHAENFPPAFYNDNGDTDLFNDTVFRFEGAKGVAPSDQMERNLILPPGIRIMGKVMLNNLAVAGIRVEAQARVQTPTGEEMDYGWGEAFSTDGFNENGFNYVISGLRPAPGTPDKPSIIYTVSIHLPAAYSEYAMQTIPVEVNATDVGNINFELTKQEGRTIFGEVFGLPNGKTAWVNAWSEAYHSGGGIEVVGTSEEFVSYQITSLIPSADYVVEIFSVDYPLLKYNNKKGWMIPDPVDISSGSADGIVFTMPNLSDLVSINGMITFPETAQLEDHVWVEAVSFTTGIQNGTEVRLNDDVYPDRQIPYAIKGLTKASDYIVSVNSPNYKNQFYNKRTGEIDADPVDVSVDDATSINFILEEGATISGKITDDNSNGQPGIEVHAWSDISRTGGHSKSGMDGTYVIRGLAEASDYIVEAADWKDQRGMFYYNKTATVRDASLASLISTEAGNQAGIDITLRSGSSIKGTVKDANGKTLSQIFVGAWSEQQKAGNGAFSKTDGTYEIKGLPAGNYEVKAEPPPTSTYLPQRKTGIASGATAVDFSLSMRTGSLSVQGTVTGKNDLGESIPISGMVVELWPEPQDMNNPWHSWAQTDASGNYSIGNLPVGNYLMTVGSPVISSYATFSTTLLLESNAVQNIELSTGRTIRGKVMLKDETPVKSACVSVYSETHNFWEQAFTDRNGNYKIGRAPTATDMVATVMKDGYAQQEQAVVFPDTGDAIADFTLFGSGAIFGSVQDESGNPIEGVQVEVYSSSLKNFGFLGTGWTDSDGNYRIEGLRNETDTGLFLSDYAVQIDAFTRYSEDGEPIRYIQNLKNGVKPGDQVDFILSTVSVNVSTQISGTITNYSEVNADYMAVDLFNRLTKRFEQHVLVKNDGSFKFVGLVPLKNYTIGFGAYLGSDEKPIRYQWAGQNEASSSVGEIPLNATSYVTGTNAIALVMDTSPLRSVRDTDEGPGTVANLRSTTHPWTSIKDLQQILRSTAQNLARNPSDSVSSSPNVTVTWDATVDNADEKYYCIFDQVAEYQIDKRNAPQPGVTTRKATSLDLSGDYQNFYFHIAVEDDRGRIGETEHLEFIIDTVAPKNPYVRANTDDNTSESGYLTLELGATGANEMYVSNTGYGEGGQWEKFTTSKEWKLSDTEAATVYVQFRDVARNTVNTVLSIEVSPTKQPTLADAIYILKVLNGISEEMAVDFMGDGIISLNDAIYVLQEIAGIR